MNAEADFRPHCTLSIMKGQDGLLDKRQDEMPHQLNPSLSLNSRAGTEILAICNHTREGEEMGGREKRGGFSPLLTQ